jgi:hypothetical protein
MRKNEWSDIRRKGELTVKKHGHEVVTPLEERRLRQNFKRQAERLMLSRSRRRAAETGKIVSGISVSTGRRMIATITG